MLCRDLIEKEAYNDTLIYILKNDGDDNYLGNTYRYAGKSGWETKKEFYSHGYSALWLELQVENYVLVNMKWANNGENKGIMIWLMNNATPG